MSYKGPRTREREGPEKIFEKTVDKNFPKMGKEIVTQVQEVQRVSYSINPRRSTLRHMLIKLTKIKYKEKILKAEKKKQQITCKRIPHKIII